jgi:catechol 2,3-dioxygenase-like lactoylglutathione lyase family enzyme
MINPTGLAAGHYECRSFDRTIPILTDVLALKIVGTERDRITLRHQNTNWLLIAHEGGPDALDKPLRNHYGVRVATNTEVDRAYEYLESNKKDLGIKIIKPKEYHNAYSVHFFEPGGNFWEIESYENAVKAGMGKTTDPHWKELLPQDAFPGKGYIPQALSHGTIEMDNLERTKQFYETVLGLEVVHLWPTSIYLKHPDTPWYIVNLQVPAENRKYVGRNQRFTLSVESAEALERAHQEITQGIAEWGFKQVDDIESNGQELSFMFCDLNANWWELTTIASINIRIPTRADTAWTA